MGGSGGDTMASGGHGGEATGGGAAPSLSGKGGDMASGGVHDGMAGMSSTGGAAGGMASAGGANGGAVPNGGHAGAGGLIGTAGTSGNSGGNSGAGSSEVACTKQGSGCDHGGESEFPVGTCGNSAAVGVCTSKPENCDSLLSPVCGCDGKTYTNDCVRQNSGVSKLADGACLPGTSN